MRKSILVLLMTLSFCTPASAIRHRNQKIQSIYAHSAASIILFSCLTIISYVHLERVKEEYEETYSIVGDYGASINTVEGSMYGISINLNPHYMGLTPNEYRLFRKKSDKLRKLFFKKEKAKAYCALSVIGLIYSGLFRTIFASR